MKFKSIRQKIATRIVWIGLVTFVLSLVLSYFLFVPALRRNAVAQSQQANAEIMQQMDSLFSYVADYTENLAPSVAQNPEILGYFSDPTYQKQRIAALHLNNLISHGGMIRCVSIDTDTVAPLDSLNKMTDADRALLRSAWHTNLSGATFGRGLSAVYPVTLNAKTYYTAAYLKNFYHANHRYTYTVFFDLSDLLYDTDVLAGALDYYALVDTNGQIFHTGGDAAWEEEAIAGVRSGTLNATDDLEGGIGFIKSSIQNKWRVVSFVSDRTILSSFAHYIAGVVAVFGLFLTLTLLFLSRTLGRMIRPITTLSAIMKTAAQGDLDCQVDIQSNDEISTLGQSFNRMIGDLRESIQIISEKEQREQRAKFSLLVSQIDPHFIYNTINSINYLARKNRCDDVITVNSALISILRDRLRVNDIQITDSIANEMHVLDQYIVIQKYMYEGNLQLLWQVDDALLQEQIPKNMIQPLVENALFHGLIDEENGEISGEIIIRIRRENGGIVLQVRDDGQGMDTETLHRVQNESYSPEDRGKKIGLSNIRGRLYYLYGGSDCLHIESTPHSGTCITLTIPVTAAN